MNAIFFTMSYLCKKVKCILKLKMVFQSLIYLLSQKITLGIIINSFGMYQSQITLWINPMYPIFQHTLIKIGLLPLQQGVILHCIHKDRRYVALDILIVVVFSSRFIVQIIGLHFPYHRSGSFTNFHFREQFGNQPFFFKGNFDPGWISHCQVKTVLLPEHFDKFQFVVEETVLFAITTYQNCPFVLKE